MKKLFAIMLVICLWLPFCAFKDVVGGAVLNSTGSVNEVVTIRYSNQDATSLGLRFNELHNASTALANATDTNSIKSILQTKYQNKIANATDLTPQEKQNMLQQVTISTASKMLENDGQFVVNITYETKWAWNWFCSDAIDKAQDTTEISLFLKKYVTQMPIKLSTVTVDEEEVSLLNFAYTLFTTKLSNTLSKDISAILSTNYSYVYASNIARLHSDAQGVEYNNSTGLTYFLWEFDFGEDTQITLWQTRANAVTWYILALVLTAGLGTTIFVVSKRKKTVDKKD